MSRSTPAHRYQSPCSNSSITEHKPNVNTLAVIYKIEREIEFLGLQMSNNSL
jgi:hypothetical protein